MSKEIKNQILSIRRTGLCNMCDIQAVINLATKTGYKELIDFLNNNEDEYVNFIFFGD